MVKLSKIEKIYYGLFCKYCKNNNTLYNIYECNGCKKRMGPNMSPPTN